MEILALQNLREKSLHLATNAGKIFSETEDGGRFGVKKYLLKGRLLLCCFLVLAGVAVQAGPAEAGIFTMSTKDEIKNGKNYARQLEKKFGLVQDLELQERVARIGDRIAAVSDRKDVPYTFKVLNGKDVNAMALPGGYIYVFKGLIDYMPSDEELAGILAHEVGHVAKRHIAKQVEKAMNMQVAAILLHAERLGIFGNLIEMAIMQGYSREDEREADQLGFIYSLRAGYNPYGMLMGLQKLNQLDPTGESDIFSSHPDSQSRVDAIEAQMREAGIQPRVIRGEKSAEIADDGLKLPPLYATYRGNKPYYRACLAAGTLYQLAKIPEFSGDYFILDSDGTYITVLYDTRPVITLTPQDAIANGTALEELANEYVLALKTWADRRKAD